MAVRLKHMPGAEPDAPKRGNKFGAVRSRCQQSHNHASAAEARRCNDLTLLERGGAIRNLVQQPKFFFSVEGRQVTDNRGRPIRYTADFGYEEKDRSGAWIDVTEDVKSTATMTEAAGLRLAFFRAFHPHTQLRITGR